MSNESSSKDFEWHGYRFRHEPGFPDDGTGGGGCAEQYIIGQGASGIYGLSPDRECAKRQLLEHLLTIKIRKLADELAEMTAEAAAMQIELNELDSDDRPHWRRKK